jgi:hypothetical protein
MPQPEWRGRQPERVWCRGVSGSGPFLLQVTMLVRGCLVANLRCQLGRIKEHLENWQSITSSCVCDCSFPEDTNA